MQRHSDNTQTQPVNLPPIDFIQIGIKHFVSGDISNSLYARITFDRLSSLECNYRVEKQIRGLVHEHKENFSRRAVLSS